MNNPYADTPALSAVWKEGYLAGIDDGERAECGKCYNRGYEQGKQDMTEDGEPLLCALVSIAQTENPVTSAWQMRQIAKDALAGETTQEDSAK